MSATGDQGPRLTSESGTTLIEALAVVAITALTALIGYPHLERSFLVLAQRQTSALVAERLRQARAEARRRDQPVALIVAADGRSFGLSMGPSIPAPLGVTVTARATNSGPIEFYGDGTSNGGRVLVSAGQWTVPVTVMPQAGVVFMGNGT
jgi:type II secretory pathway pseudopilin PulG